MPRGDIKNYFDLKGFLSRVKKAPPERKNEWVLLAARTAKDGAEFMEFIRALGLEDYVAPFVEELKVIAAGRPA